MELNYRPANLSIEISKLCNLKCSFCWRGSKPKHIDHINKQTPYNIIPLELFKKIIDDAVQYDHIKWIALCGPIGESLTAPNLSEYTEYVNNKNHFSTSLINTNGTLLHKHDPGKLLNNLTEIVISLDSVNEETYYKIHPQGDFQQLLKNIKDLAEYKKNYGGKAAIKVRFTETAENKGEFPEFEEYFKNIVDEVKHVKVHSFMGIKEEENSYAGAVFCNQVYNVINLNIKGELTTCCCNWMLSPSFGSMEKNSLAELWCNNEYNEWVEKRLDTTCKNCSGIGNIFSQSLEEVDQETLDIFLEEIDKLKQKTGVYYFDEYKKIRRRMGKQYL